MKKMVIYVSVMLFGTVIVFGGTKGTVGGPGTTCGGSSCTITIAKPNGKKTKLTVTCTQETTRAQSVGRTNQPGELCGKCNFGGGTSLGCGSSSSGEYAEE
jgi:hypothetical protein